MAYIRVQEGTILDQQELLLMASGTVLKPVEIGCFNPSMKPVKSLSAGEVGYVATGLKTVQECRVGDTVTSAQNPSKSPLSGYKTPKSMVFAGFFPVEGEDYEDLRDALENFS